MVHLKFYKIWKFKNHVTRNDVIMMSLPKTMEDNKKMRISAEPNKIYINQKVLMRAIQKCEFETLSKVMGIYVKFTKTTHHIWSCHVTLASNSEKGMSDVPPYSALSLRFLCFAVYPVLT